MAAAQPGRTTLTLLITSQLSFTGSVLQRRSGRVLSTPHMNCCAGVVPAMNLFISHCKHQRASHHSNSKRSLTLSNNPGSRLSPVSRGEKVVQVRSAPKRVPPVFKWWPRLQSARLLQNLEQLQSLQGRGQRRVIYPIQMTNTWTKPWRRQTSTLAARLLASNIRNRSMS